MNNSNTNHNVQQVCQSPINISLFENRTTVTSLKTASDMATGKKSTMRMFFVHETDRYQMDVEDSRTVGEVKESVRYALRLGSDERSASSESHEKKILSLSFAGATLDDSWRLADLGIPSGSLIKVFFREEVNPSFLLFRRFNQQTTPVFQPINFRTAYGRELRSIVTRVTGLPVGAFRLTNWDGVEVYDCQTLDRYGLELGGTIYLETWDGWNELLVSSLGGFSNQVLQQLDVNDDEVAYFQLKTALYIAAHYGLVDLAESIIKYGARSDEPVGEHPTRAWVGRGSRHVDSYKTPVHEAAEMGQLTVLRYFVHQDVGAVFARDGNNLTPLSLALRHKQQACATFLITKQLTKVSCGKKGAVTLETYVRLRRWAEVARDRVMTLYGSSKSSRRPAARSRYNGESILLGHGVQLDGYTTSLMTSKPASKAEAAKKKSTTVRDSVADRRMTTYQNSGVLQSLELPTVSNGLPQLASHRNVGSTVSRSDLVDEMSTDEKSHNGSVDVQSPPLRRVQPATNVDDRSTKLSPEGTSQVNSDATRWRFLTSRQSTGEGFYLQSNGDETAIPDGNVSNSPSWQAVSTSRQSDRRKAATTSLKRPKKTNRKLSKSLDLSPNDDHSRRKTKFSSALELHTELKLPAVAASGTDRLWAHSNQVAVDTKRSFERERGLRSRDYAIHCLALAQRFNQRPWLDQVRQGVAIATAGVKRVYRNQPHLFENTPRAITTNDST